MKSTLFILIMAISLVPFAGCEKKGNGTDENVSVPSGDQPFPPLTTSWVIDNVGVMEKDSVERCHVICQRLKDYPVAEVVVLIQNGVKHPSDYATHYGRWLKLGAKGLSTQGGNNGLVWLIRPDAEEKMTYSVGRGLPLLTSGHMVDIMNKAKDYLNFNNYDQGVTILVQETEKQLVQIYGKKGETK